MPLSQQIAKHFRDVFFGGNWTSVNVKDTLAGVTLEQARAQVGDLNTIAVLVFHINYYVAAVLKVLQGSALEASDKLSFDLPAFRSEEDWRVFVATVLQNADQFASALERLEDDLFFTDFSEGKYGNYYRNIAGIIEHTHYHLGQIALMKKLTATTSL